MTALQIVGLGHAANMVLPFHVGEGLRAAFFPKGYSAMRRTKLLIIPAFADFTACSTAFYGMLGYLLYSDLDIGINQCGIFLLLR